MDAMERSRWIVRAVGQTLADLAEDWPDESLTPAEAREFILNTPVALDADIRPEGDSAPVEGVGCAACGHPERLHWPVLGGAFDGCLGMRGEASCRCPEYVPTSVTTPGPMVVCEPAWILDEDYETPAPRDCNGQALGSSCECGHGECPTTPGQEGTS